MFKNYFKSAWRTLIKNKFYSIVNISGIAVGLTVGILILLWVQDEFSFDTFNHKAKEIYRLENMVGTGTSRQIWENTAAPIGVLAKNEIPGVEGVARISNNGYYALYKYKDKVFNEQNTVFADPSLFTMFDFKIIEGDGSNPFPDNNSVVMTEETAKKYFGNEDPIGRVISADDKINFKVTGIIKNIPRNSSIRHDIFFPMTLLAKNMYANNTTGLNLDNDFIQFSYETYLLLKPGISLPALATKLRDIHLSHKADDVDVAYLLQPLLKMHLCKADGSDGGIKTVQMFIIIALLILLIACINYVNLSTARSMLRAKEVSVRKIIGAARFQLFMQFIIETALLFLIATLFALVFVYALMPVFNQVSGKELIVNFRDYHIWEVILFTIAGTLIISSVYPALLLSSFEPLKALKGKISTRISDAMFRKILVVSQFVFSIVLIAGTIIITNQMNFIRSQKLGYDKDHVFSLPMIAMSQHFDAVKSDLLKQPGVADVTWADGNIVDIGSQTGDNSWDGKENGETMMLSPMAIGKDFIPFFKMQMAEGNNFTGSIADSTHFILNETAVKAARLKDPIGKKFRLWKTEGTIIGVVKDFYFQSMKEKIKPAIFYYQPGKYGQIYVKTAGKDAPKAIAAVQDEWKKYNAAFPFTYSFLDDTFNNLYQSEQRTGTLFNVFALIAIFISCLGLFGLATYTAEVKRKEIGIRKVLGANVSGIVKLISKDFLKLVFISILIATPIAWWAMNKWLEGFAYRINIAWWVFALAGALALLIALITVSFQSVKAAVANPVKSLRSE
jgi:putative ABC transport system permease protein